MSLFFRHISNLLPSPYISLSLTCFFYQALLFMSLFVNNFLNLGLACLINNSKLKLKLDLFINKQVFYRVKLEMFIINLVHLQPLVVSILKISHISTSFCTPFALAKTFKETFFFCRSALLNQPFLQLFGWMY